MASTISSNNCSPVLQTSEIDPNYIGYKIMNADGTLSNPTSIPQMTLRSKSINSAKTIIENGNNSNIPLRETFTIGDLDTDLIINPLENADAFPELRNNSLFLVVSFGLLFGIMYLWKK